MISKKKLKLKRFIKITLFVVTIMTLAIFGMFVVLYQKTDLNVQALTSTNNGVELYDINNVRLENAYNENKEIVDISELPDYVKNAFIAIEDKRFYNHNGYDLKRILKAVLVNLKSGEKSQGASTITQQLVKNTLLNSNKTYKRKVKEIMLAIKTEKKFSKEEILNMYLNTIYFGGNAYGIQTASQVFFDKNAEDLSLNEACILAGIIKSPSQYSPRNNYDKCFIRKQTVLKLMLENGFIGKAEYDDTINEEIVLSSQKNNYTNSYFQMAIKQACNELNTTEKDLIMNQYKIYTNIDISLQNKLKNVITSSNENISENFDVDADELIIACDVKGNVLAYLGDSYYDLSNMKRQPASLIKPILVYSPALTHNILTPATPILDEKIDFNGYKPQNFGNKYHGWTSMRDCVSQSLNIPAVKTLEYITLEKCKNYAEKLELDLIEDDYNYSLALGSTGLGIAPIKLLSSYSTLANGGLYNNCSFINKIETKNGNIVYKNLKQNEQIFDKNSTYLMTDVLNTCATSGTAKVLNDLPFDVASKTGTLGDNIGNSDLWNVAYTNDICVLSWIGDASGGKLLPTSMSSGKYPTSLTKSVLDFYYQNREKPVFKRPDDIVEFKIDKIQYDNYHKVVLASEYLPERFTLTEIFDKNNLPPSSEDPYNLPAIINAKIQENKIEISFETNKLFSYKLYKVVNGNATLLGEVTENDGLYVFWDKVDSKKVEYYYERTQNFLANKIDISDTVSLYPNEKVISKNENKTKNIVPKSTKKKWYV